jgi:uncharacterized membrane protein YfcA
VTLPRLGFIVIPSEVEESLIVNSKRCLGPSPTGISLDLTNGMDSAHLILLSLAIALIAFLYSSVGHAGASGYIAIMTLWGISATVIRPTALVLNILVATIGAFQFYRAGHFSWKLFWPFAVLSIPAAYIGGYLQPSASLLRVLIGLVLLFSAARLIFRRRDPEHITAPSAPVAIGVGGGLGFLAGLTGTGGGIFLTPLLLFCSWAKIRQAAAVSALFILVNSIGGLVGYFTAKQSVPSLGVWLALPAIVGGAIGSQLGSRRFPVRAISLLLATVLTVAGAKLIFTR